MSELAQFHDQSKELYQKIIGCEDKNDVVALRAQVVSLNRMVEGQMEDLPGFERKRLASNLESLFKVAELKLTQLDTRKFEFEGEPVGPAVTRNKIDETSRKVEDAKIVAAHSDKSSSYVNVQDMKLTLESGAGSHVLVTNAVRCVVRTDTNAIPASVHVKGSSNSIFDLESSGPIFAHDLTHTTVVVRCHQLRLHNARSTTIVIREIGSSNTIITENCRDLKIGTIDNQPFQVDDFDWPSRSKNPHYTVLEDAQKTLHRVHELMEGALGEGVASA